MWPFPFVLRQCSRISDLGALGTWGLWVRDPQPTPISPSVQVHWLITLDSQLWQAFQLQASSLFHRSLSFGGLLASLADTSAHVLTPRSLYTCLLHGAVVMQPSLSPYAPGQHSRWKENVHRTEMQSRATSTIKVFSKNDTANIDLFLCSRPKNIWDMKWSSTLKGKMYKKAFSWAGVFAMVTKFNLYSQTWNFLRIFGE